MNRFKLTLAATFLALWANAQAGQLLNVDFGSVLPDVPRKVGKAAFGFSDQDFWNVVANGNSSGLIWADGNNAGIDLSIANAGGLWGSDAADPMMHTYLYQG